MLKQAVHTTMGPRLRWNTAPVPAHAVGVLSARVFPVQNGSISLHSVQLRYQSTVNKTNNQTTESKQVEEAHRSNTKEVEAATRGQFDGLHILSIPVTSNKSYIWCHRPVTSAQAQRFPAIHKVENKLTGWALKGWTKLSTSKNSVNVRITKFVQGLLDTIPYEENCLKSFPSKNTMIRELKESLEKETTLIQTEIDNLSIPVEDLKPIKVFHPQFQNPESILAQMTHLHDSSYKSHKKYAILCAVGIPISLPFALVPVLPNIPGFYLSYRLYSNIKALLGVKHMEYLLESKGTTHLSFESIPALDEAYSAKSEVVPGSKETILLDESSIERLSEAGLGFLKDDLHKALKQETARLTKSPSPVNN